MGLLSIMFKRRYDGRDWKVLWNLSMETYSKEDIELSETLLRQKVPAVIMKDLLKAREKDKERETETYT